MTITKKLRTSTLLNQADEDTKICTDCGADIEEGVCPGCNDLDESAEEGEVEGLFRQRRQTKSNK